MFALKSAGDVIEESIELCERDGARAVGIELAPELGALSQFVRLSREDVSQNLAAEVRAVVVFPALGHMCVPRLHGTEGGHA